MDQSLVCAVMLTNGRPEMVRRAVASFRAQTYPDKELLIWNTEDPQVHDLSEYEADDIAVVWCPGDAGKTIGQLRNSANSLTDDGLGIEAGIIAHWDSDDYSHPKRLTEQVALLEASGKECVGYRDMLFYSTPDVISRREILANAPYQAGTDSRGLPIMVQRGVPFDVRVNLDGESWRYTNDDTRYCLGTSMLYWRKTWEAHPFADSNEGCDDLDWYRNGVQMQSVSSLFRYDNLEGANNSEQPRMIATIHGANTTAHIDTASPMWSRVPAWDDYCRKALAL